MSEAVKHPIVMELKGILEEKRFFVESSVFDIWNPVDVSAGKGLGWIFTSETFGLVQFNLGHYHFRPTHVVPTCTHPIAKSQVQHGNVFFLPGELGHVSNRILQEEMSFCSE